MIAAIIFLCLATSISTSVITTKQPNGVNFENGQNESSTMKIIKDKNAAFDVYPAEGFLAGYNTPIWKVKKNPESSRYLTQLNPTGIFEKIVNRKPGITKAQIVTNTQSNYSKIDVVYPRLLIAMDKSLFDKFYNTEKAIEYILSYWNFMDMNFRFFENPKIRFNIAGIVLAIDEDLPYMLENKINSSYKVDLAKALENSGAFWYSQKKIMPHDFDIAITMTANELFVKDEKKSKFSETVEAAINSESICSRGPQKSHVTSLVVNDKGSYDHLITLLRQIALLFGLNTTRTCHLEGELTYGPSLIQQISKCALKDFDNFFHHSSNASCLLTKPNPGGTSLPRYLPGHIFDADQQCQQLGFAKAMTIRENCNTMRCQLHNGKYEDIKNFPALMGTTCAENSICVYKKCLDL